MAIMAAWLLSALADGACRHVGGHRSASALAEDKVKKKNKSFLHTREMKEFERSDLGSNWME